MSLYYKIMTKTEIASYIDHTLLAPDAGVKQIQKLCTEAVNYKFASVCINPCYVPFASNTLAGTGVKVCTVIGFPFGTSSSEVKAFEAVDAIKNGADEIDMVINVGALKAKNYDFVEKDIAAVVEAANGKLVKVIIETCLLTDEEKTKVCKLAKKAGADFVKTSTGFNKSGATPEDIALMRKAVGPEMGVKASGGVRDTEAALAMIKNGATRIGASASIAIIEGLK